MLGDDFLLPRHRAEVVHRLTPCMPAGEDEDGNVLELMVADPSEICGTDTYWTWFTVILIFGVLIYCVGFPLVTFIAARRYQLSNKEDISSYERISVLISVYEPKYVFMEALNQVHKLCLTGVVFVFTESPRLQLWFGVVIGLLYFVLYMMTLPFKSDMCDWVQNAVLLSLLLVYASAFLFLDDVGENGEHGAAEKSHTGDGFGSPLLHARMLFRGIWFCFVECRARAPAGPTRANFAIVSIVRSCGHASRTRSRSRGSLGRRPSSTSS